MATSETRVVSLRAAAAMCVATAAVFFLGVFAAHAWEGRPGVETRSSFTVAGTVTLPPGETLRTLSFRFYQEADGGVGRTCPASGMMNAQEVRYTAPTFSAQIPYGDCGRDFFDGSNVWFELAVNGAPIAGRFQVNPVPYAQFASVAGSVGTPDCPLGYERNPLTPTGRTYCRKFLSLLDRYDEVVKVGSGASAFWIDRYEALIFSRTDRSVLLNARSPSDLVERGLPNSGQWRGTDPPLLAISLEASNPPARWITWHQAEEMCRASGKRLPTGAEWLAAARGTAGTGEADCRVSGDVRDISQGSTCASDWGAQDMVGNVWEWTSDWYAGVGVATTPVLPILPDGGTAGGAVALAPAPANSNLGGVRVNNQVSPWPTGYGNDGTWNVTSVAARGLGDDNTMGMPAAALRGGSWESGPRAGVYALSLSDGPSSWAPSVGFRCVIPR